MTRSMYVLCDVKRIHPGALLLAHKSLTDKAIFFVLRKPLIISSSWSIQEDLAITINLHL